MGDLMVWKYTWNDLLSDTEFRKYFAKSSMIDVTYLTNTTFKITLPKRLTKKGTIYLYSLKDEEAHFVSYEIHGRDFIIHDPADLNVRYTGWLSLHALDALKKKLPKFTVSVSNVHPQKCIWDTFCQTWSLAQLMGVSLSDVTKMKSRRMLYDIIQKIAHDPKFARYIKHNSDVIQGWMVHHVKKYGGKLKTPTDFISFSRSLKYKDFQRF